MGQGFDAQLAGGVRGGAGAVQTGGEQPPTGRLVLSSAWLAQLLQLEVQLVMLCQDRLGMYIRVEEYILGRALTISYLKPKPKCKYTRTNYHLLYQTSSVTL